nr:12005_t:CDS:2 [Entrophospora candida]
MSNAYPEYVEEFSIEISDFDPISPTCHISLPDTMPKRNNSVINMQNNDEWCFGWCVLGALHPVKVHPERNPHLIYANYINELNMKGIPVPVPVSTPVYQKFEENNPEISLCVYKWSNENKRIEFQYISEKRKKDYKEVNLLVISEPDEIENPRSHYCIIKDIHRLVYNHRINGAPQEPKVPKLEKSTTKAFYNHKCMQANPYRIFWDLECLTTKLTSEEDAQLTRTEKIQRHIPCGYKKFVDKLEVELADINLDLSEPAKMIMEYGDYTRHRKATECWICKKDFPDQKKIKIMVCCPNTGNYVGASHRECKNKNEIIGPKWYQQPSIGDNVTFKEAKECMYCKEKDMLDIGLSKVQDHCHISGKYRGPAHSNCNKKLQMGPFKTKVPLICHNFQGYDSHLLIEVVSRFTSNRLKCIPENVGKYKAMDVGQLHFLDSFQHMSMGLDKLVECMNSNLEKKDFYSLLNQQNISKADYAYAQEVWQKFEMKTFSEYHDLYLETDVLLLVDVFMNYTIMCLKDDGLGPSHYVSAPGMFNDSLYKSSGAEIKLLTDLDQYMLVERGICGGMSMVSQRYAKANNPQCPDYDENKPNSWVMYEDMNALYSGAMMQYLPTEILGKVAPEAIPNILEIPIDSEEGYLLEVDMEVLLNLHDLFNDYPLAPEKANGKCPDEDKKLKRLTVSPLYVDLFLMKDECKGIPISEAVCLKLKVYSVLPVGHDPKTPKTEADFEKELEEEGWQKKHGIQKAKGVKKSVVKRELRHDKFLECLKTRKITRHDMYGLRLNPYDNKRWILSDGIRTLPYGHWRIRAYKKFVASGVIPEEAEKRAMKLTLKPENQ